MEAIAPLLETVRRRKRVSAQAPSTWPAGALYAVLVVAAVHLLVTGLIYPEPMPRRDLRRKVLPLTRQTPPQLVIFGDSRAECGFLPGLVATHAGLPPRAAINIAIPAGEAAAGVAAYREYGPRFAAHPIMLITISLFSVNDRAADELIGPETLWSLGIVDRLRLVPVKRALTATFLPERELLQRQVIEPLLLQWKPEGILAEQGYRGKDRHPPITADSVRHKLDELERRWFNDAVIDGVRWRLLERNLQELADAGVQVVIVDPPEHPLLLAALAGSPSGRVNAQFHRQLAELGGRRNLPLLRYDAATICPEDPESIFISVMHVNRQGAERMSRRAGEDLRRLIESGALHAAGVDSVAGADGG